MAKVRVAAFGGCNLRAPIVRAQYRSRQTEPSAWRGVPRGYRVMGPPFFTYTIGEMEQALACYRGERSIPDDLLSLCGMDPDTAPTPANSFLSKIDVALVEPNTSIEFTLDGVRINRRPISKLLQPLRQLGLEASRQKTRWFEQGIAGVNADVRRSSADTLVSLIPENFPNRPLIVRVLMGVTSTRPPVREGLRRLAETVGAPIGVALFAWSYMPDGRALSWPSNFLGEVSEAATDLGIPQFDPRPLVRAAEVEAALYGDRRHYTDAFMPTIATPLVDFMFAAAGRERPTGASRRKAAR